MNLYKENKAIIETNLIAILVIILLSIYILFSINFSTVSFLIYGAIVLCIIFRNKNKQFLILLLSALILLNLLGFLFYAIQTSYYTLPKLGGSYLDDEGYINDAIKLANNYRISYLWDPNFENIPIQYLILSNSNPGFTFILGSFLALTKFIFGSFSTFHIIFFNNLFGLSLVSLTYKISYKIEPSKFLALKSALICLLYPMISFYCSVVLKDMLTALLVSYLFYLAYWRDKSILRNYKFIMAICVLFFLRVNVAIPMLFFLILAKLIPRYEKITIKNIYKSTSVYYKVLIVIMLPVMVVGITYIVTYALAGYQDVANNIGSYSADNKFRYFNSFFFTIILPFPSFRSIVYWGQDSMTYFIWSDLGAIYWHLIVVPLSLLGFWQFYKTRKDNYLLIWFICFLILFTISLFVDERRRLMFVIPFFIFAAHSKIYKAIHYWYLGAYYCFYIALNVGYLLYK